NGGMLAPGLKSMIVAASLSSIVCFVWLSTTSLAGALPQEHCSVAPMTTAFGMMRSSVNLCRSGGRRRLYPAQPVTWACSPTHHGIDLGLDRGIDAAAGTRHR